MHRRNLLAIGLALSAALAVSACGKSGGGAASGGGGSGVSISGAGATFPAPLYGKWAETYKAQTGVALNYQPIGSGGGVKQIEAKTVDFGASDKPLKPDALAAAGLYQFPTVVGGVAPVIDLPGIAPGQLKLTGSVLADIFADIFAGVISRWNDPQIAALNPGVALPQTKITVVHRSDGSGTSFLFTTYLSSANPAWQSKVGASDAVQWPTGIGGKGNDGVAAFVKQTVGAIGYVEYAYAKQNAMTYVQLKNKDGAFVSPNAGAFSAAAAGADWAHAAGNYLLLIDQPGANSWPITGATFILVYKQPTDAGQAKAVLSFFDWAYKTGDATAGALDYIPLPDAVKTMVRGQWADQVKGPDGKPVYSGS